MRQHWTSRDRAGIPWLGAVLVLAGLCLSPGVLMAQSADEFHQAAGTGDLERLAALASAGNDLNVRDETGQSPLITAALAGQSAAAAFLIEQGADVHARTDRGLMPLHAAAYSGDFDTAVLLVKKGARVSDAENSFGITPLHAAVEENHRDIVELLVISGVELDVPERSGYTALSRAMFAEYWELAELLAKAGALCQSEEIIGLEFHGLCVDLKP